MDMSELSVDAARALAASASTLGTDCSSCSVAFERGVRCGFEGWWEEKYCEGRALGRVSMSRSKIADEEERLTIYQGIYITGKKPIKKTYIDVGEDGIDVGDLEPGLLGDSELMC